MLQIQIAMAGFQMPPLLLLTAEHQFVDGGDDSAT